MSFPSHCQSWRTAPCYLSMMLFPKFAFIPYNWRPFSLPSTWEHRMCRCEGIHLQWLHNCPLAWLDDAFVECLRGIHVWRELQLFLLRWDRERGEGVWWLPVGIPAWNNYTCMKIWNLVLLKLWVVCGLSQEISASSWVALTFSHSVTRSCTSLLTHSILQNTSWRIFKGYLLT